MCFIQIAKIIYEGSDGEWHTATTTIPKGLYQVVFEVHSNVHTDIRQKHPAGIDDIQVISGACEVKGGYY